MQVRPAGDRARVGVARAADPRARGACDRLQVARGRDLAAQPRDPVPRDGRRHRRSPAPRRAAHVRRGGRRLRRARGPGRGAGLRRGRDRAVPDGTPARDALDADRGGGPGAPGDRLVACRLRDPRAAQPRHRRAPGDDPRRADRQLGAAHDRRDAADAHGRVDRRGGCTSVRAEPGAADRRARAHRRRPLPARAERGRGLGARRLRRRAGSAQGRRVLPADLAACRAAGEDGRPQRRGVARHRRGEAVQLQVDGAVRQPRPLQGGGEGVPLPAARLSRVVARPHVPPEPDPGQRAQGARGGGLDGRAPVRAATSPRSGRSVSPVRCARTLTNAQARTAPSPPAA